MRIAIVFSGHLRSFRNTHSSFQQLRSVLSQHADVDVFCHTWDVEESVTASWWKDHAADTPPPPNVNADELIRLYQPVRFRIEPSKKFEEPPVNIKSIIPVSGLLSMLYSQYSGLGLMEEYQKENNISYNLVIKTRYDLGFEIASAFDEMIGCAVDEQCVFVPNTNPYELAGACADIFALGPPKGMNEYFRFYERFSEALSVYESCGYRELIPELLLKTYLDHYKVKHAELEGMRLHILRTSGERFRICSDKNFEGNEPHCFFRQTILRNRDVLPLNSPVLKANTEVLIGKYLRWIDPSFNTDEIQRYCRFYYGEWPGKKAIKKLAQKSAKTNVFLKIVMKSFFEEALWSSRYGLFRRLLFAFILLRHGSYGGFYFRVIKKIIGGQSPA